jgi:ectoine hydroxylase-related dioxygenase (phytanoyl-CoA dioxygenase family)
MLTVKTPSISEVVETLTTVGLVTVDGIFSQREMATFRSLADATSAAAAGKEEYKGRSTEQLLHRGANDTVWYVADFYEICEGAIRFTRHPAIIDVLQTLWGHESLSYGNSGLFFDKQTATDVEIGWHQDSHFAVVPPAGSAVDCQDYWQRLGRFHVRPTQLEWTEDFHRSNVIVRINIDEQTRENGCLRVLPGSHECGPFELTGGLDEYVNAHEAEAIDVVAAEGSVTFHYPTIVHSSGQNTQTGIHRRVAAHRFRRSGLRIPGWDWPPDLIDLSTTVLAEDGFDLNPFATAVRSH